ncbi:pimeloyl-ACP methyl ester carboxylesterase [Conyzicola lurida]|uniref:Pimeloyl-ACP methyl ester carboxylesterase n=1 Tax=Conyzicola lurida TaxID=1172621 RepID=A0A841AL35_9MICO|nr:alpha/beta hydrolase [Conyzicola lurida]MBB5842185.1 pimeloyl-ACP methyl ester carboxylesterase [Conyzicola lurida]
MAVIPRPKTPGLARISTELVTIETADGWVLDALHYPARESRTVLLHLHGKGANMLGVQARFLPEMLPTVAHLSLNMRCHDLAYNTDRGDRPVAGGMYERLDDGKVDIAAAISFLRGEGYELIVVCGHSSGGYYAGEYGVTGDPVAGRVLLSPLFTNTTALGWWYPGDGELEAALTHARALVDTGRPDEIIALPSWYWAISARSLLERAAQPEGLWLDAVNRDSSPVLMMWGETEDRNAAWSGLLAQIDAPAVGGPIDGSDHWYGGYETVVADAVAGFVSGLTGVPVAVRASE